MCVLCPVTDGGAVVVGDCLIKAAVFNFRHGRLSRLLPVSCVPMATASEAGDGREVWLVRLFVAVCGQVARRRRRWRGRRAPLVRTDRPRLGVGGDVGLAARDNGSPDRDMDRTARPDAVRVGRGGGLAALR